MEVVSEPEEERDTQEEEEESVRGREEKVGAHLPLTARYNNMMCVPASELRRWEEGSTHQK